MDKITNIIRSIASARHDLRYDDWQETLKNIDITPNATHQKLYDDAMAHYQSGENITNKLEKNLIQEKYKKRIHNLQNWMRENQLQFFLLPRSDRYQNEFLPACSQRIQWLTGFSGSHGFLILGLNQCLLISDSRYTIQMEQQTPDNVTCYTNTKNMSGERVKTLLTQNIQPGDKIGFPQWQMPIQYYQFFSQIITQKQATLEGFLQNPIDLFWQTHRDKPLALVSVFPKQYCDATLAHKISQIRALFITTLNTLDHGAIFINDLNFIAWLLNLRGGDIPYTPVSLCFLMVTEKNIFLWIDQYKLPPNVLQYCVEHHIHIYDFKNLNETLARFKGNICWLDPKTTPIQIQTLLKNAHCNVHYAPLPMQENRAIKTEAQIKHIQNAHIIDGVAMVRFLSWFANQETASECKIVEKLESYRALNKDYRGASFATIAAFNANGAIIHYQPNIQTQLQCYAKINSKISPKNNLEIGGNNLLLLDSGGQYLQGTTDITRTIAFHQIDNLAIKHDYSLVLKCHINLAMLRFPKGTTGAQCDAICRNPLWQEGKNYSHGTGHGVGMYLGVHEGPYNISPNSHTPFRAGILLSNEPGIYHPGQYGIRIENLMVSKAIETETASEKDWLIFETLTLCPMDCRLIIPELLDPTQIQWLNAYHQKVRTQLLPALTAPNDAPVREWLLQATQAL